MKKVSLILLIMLVAPAFIFAQDQAQKPLKIAVINVQKVMEDSEIGKASRERISKFFEQKRNELQAEANALQQELAQLQSQRSVLTAEAVVARENELQKKDLDLKQKSQNSDRLLQSMQQEELQKFFKVAGPVIETIGVEQGFTIIMDNSPSRTNQILYLDKTIDLTNLVVQRVNAAAKNQPK